MEERIIDDEYGRGIRLKKTKDGYVDVTDELAEDTDSDTEELVDEVAFAFPDLETDETDEDLIGLTPEEVEKKLQQREQKAAERRAKGAKFCEEGEKALAEAKYADAKKAFTKAMKFISRNEESEKEVEFASRSQMGLCKALSENFENPDALLEEYVERGVENFEYDVGYETLETLRKDHKELFKQRYEAIVAEETPLKESVEVKQQKRREYLKSRMIRAIIAFFIALLPVIGFGIATAVVGMKNYSTPDDRYVMPTIVLGAVTFVFFIVFIVFANKLINAFRLKYKNEKLEATDEGERLVYLRAMKELYEFLLEIPTSEKANAEENEESVANEN